MPLRKSKYFTMDFKCTEEQINTPNPPISPRHIFELVQVHKNGKSSFYPSKQGGDGLLRIWVRISRGTHGGKISEGIFTKGERVFQYLNCSLHLDTCKNQRRFCGLPTMHFFSFTFYVFSHNAFLQFISTLCVLRLVL